MTPELQVPPTAIEIAQLVEAAEPSPTMARIVRRMVFQIDRLDRANAELRRDAERYLIVRQRCSAALWAEFSGRDQGYCLLDIDAAIDAALKGAVE